MRNKSDQGQLIYMPSQTERSYHRRTRSANLVVPGESANGMLVFMPANYPLLTSHLLEEDNALHRQQLGSQSDIPTPTPSTAMCSLVNLDTFIQSLTQELLHSPK